MLGFGTKVNSVNTINTDLSYNTNSNQILDANTNILGSELNSSIRFTRYNNPLINYSYKSGHYIGIWDKLYPSLMTSFIEVAKNVIKASWVFSPDFSPLLLENYKTFNSFFVLNSKIKTANIDS